MLHKLLSLSVDNRKASAVKRQEVLTKEVCCIKTRVGLHENVNDNCSNKGIIILELVGEEKDYAVLLTRLDQVKGVTSQLVSL